MVDDALRDELVAMAEEGFAAQIPIAELLERDEQFARWADQVFASPRATLGLAEWTGGSAPPELVAIHEISDRHDLRLSQIIAAVGWPGRSTVGEDGADAAWALAQHADRHNPERTSWLELLARAVAVRDADPRHLARLTDRVAMIGGTEQFYGTYARLDEAGLFVFQFPAAGDVEQVDKRRADIGLPPLLADLKEPVDAGPYRHFRKTAAFAWPPPRT